MGWKTTRITREIMTSALISALHNRELKLWSAIIVDEMLTFTRDKMGRPVHKPGKHDDTLFGLMIALQLHLRCPREHETDIAESTLDMDAIHDTGQVPGYAYVGGRDDFDPSENEFDLGMTE